MRPERSVGFVALSVLAILSPSSGTKVARDVIPDWTTSGSDSGWVQCAPNETSQTYECKENALWICSLGRCECNQDYAFNWGTRSCEYAPGVDDLELIAIQPGQKGFQL
ncbi:uncharacterized protein BJ171DRAFT_582441 [Polychytrium aggregatum]|uniref:uncharacterized protein n=1 Tax=Polychytrium aggregatum TaxID=110093 RepID=UPI0022FDE2CE|nr:uncharacterized protein BJ171DRAFT_582441 [Polychytrium aggregatum]KAI9204061.1 hypothetical protein BJ171DRAFT_582441 [Polychytrium aggregatum]